jgi:hypothetical protein
LMTTAPFKNSFVDRLLAATAVSIDEVFDT